MGAELPICVTPQLVTLLEASPQQGAPVLVLPLPSHPSIALAVPTVSPATPLPILGPGQAAGASSKETEKAQEADYLGGVSAGDVCPRLHPRRLPEPTAENPKFCPLLIPLIILRGAGVDWNKCVFLAVELSDLLRLSVRMESCDVGCPAGPGCNYKHR